MLEFQVEELRLTPAQVDADTFSALLPATLALARKHRLSIFDATYLELAMRRRLPLAAFDAALLRAAAAEQVTILT